MDDLIRAITKEIFLRKDFLKTKELSSVYFGGGTPSMLKGEHLEILWERITKLFILKKNAEITLEVNPDDIDSDTISNWKIFPFNRVSIGIQSFEDEILKYLNRIHNSERAVYGFNLLRDAGFDNINVDLIYGIPVQTENQWHNTLEKALRLNPEHLSAYCLTLEDKTALSAFIDKGKSPRISEESGAVHFEWLMFEMRKHGFTHYEISNFCKPGFESRHNLSYWTGEEYLGVGPGAHSHKKNIREWVIPHNVNYIKSLSDNILPLESETLTNENLLAEYILLCLRTSEGCSLSYLKKKFNKDLLKDKEKQIADCVEKKFVVISDNKIILTDRGKLVADKIALELL
ncbi:MAG: hypothetical protein A3H98_13330 [Bacteroidetes bacterium RIFCSPLOWO2_02_FULL_36_8]|nr:MAG: hypothetical protein A3H98_13330 [Bacteroidetes bacterium RIFCSPLOWO2_02_FULL_36_8]OFY70169.1 MAG: hypothetical protein A3G23_08445 [Bacteroidetes bacterium RIFCSPLOWO2_12_FULL_37_12]